MTSTTVLRADTWERIDRTIQQIHALLIDSTRALNNINVPYAVIGGHAVAHWVSTVEPIAARGTPNVNLMINRTDFQRSFDALCGLGYEQVPVHGQMRLIDPLHESNRKRCSRYVGLHYCNEQVNLNDKLPNPGLDELAWNEQGYWVLSLEKLVPMKLDAFRLIDRVHLIDLLQVQIIDASWAHRYPPPLSERLLELCELDEVKQAIALEEAFKETIDA